MCGLAGIFDLEGRRPLDERRLWRMTRALAHRGPDGEGKHAEPGLLLGHRRLAIIDPKGGRQPVYNETGRAVVVFNGEIYNFAELAAELSRRGHRFATRCDTEVIVHAWEEWGESALQRFNGMFAFALWDADRETLVLARDRLGEKPLYWTVEDDLLLFASEFGALLAGMRDLPPLDAQAIEEYFAYGYVPDPKTIRKGIHKLPPGSRLAVVRRSGAAARLLANGGGTPQRWWSLRFAPAEDRMVDPMALADELRGRLEEAVRARLISDVPLGAFLSGGLDSSGIVALMARLPGSFGGRVRTCTMGFADPRFDESPWAEAMARHVGADHHAERVDPEACGLFADGPDGLIDRLAAVYGEPFADSSAVPTYLLCGVARRRVTVALSGDGGDEAFAGYRRYRMHAREEAAKHLLPTGLRRLLFGPLAAFYPALGRAPQWLRAQATFEAMAGDALDGHFRAVQRVGDRIRVRLLSGDLRRALRGYHAIEALRAARRTPGLDPVAAMQEADLLTWLPGMMLVKVDRASMAHGLEVRPPLLDPELVEWAATLPRGAKLRAGAGKAALKDALASLLPPELVDRRKQGFSPPLADWLRGGLRRRIEALPRSAALRDSGAVDPAGVKRLVREHLQGRDHAAPLWSVLMFDAFLRLPTGPRAIGAC